MITRYVDPNAEAGGDGTTDGLTGATCAYQSLSIFAAAENTGTLSDHIKCICKANGSTKVVENSYAFSISGATASATNYIEITVDPTYHHLGYYDSGKVYIEGRLEANQDYTIVEGLCGDGIVTHMFATLENCVGVKIRNLVLRDTYNSEQTFLGSYGVTFENCISFGSGMQAFKLDSGAVAVNCTAYASNTSYSGSSLGAIEANGGAVKNCLVAGTLGDMKDFVFSNSCTINNCASEDDTADDTTGGSSNSNSRINQTFTFVDSGALDLNLASNDAGARTYGTSTGAPADDVQLRTRVSRTYIDIGASQVTQDAAGGSRASVEPYYRNLMGGVS